MEIHNHGYSHARVVRKYEWLKQMMESELRLTIELGPGAFVVKPLYHGEQLMVSDDINTVEGFYECAKMMVRGVLVAEKTMVEGKEQTFLRRSR